MDNTMSNHLEAVVMAMEAVEALELVMELENRHTTHHHKIHRHHLTHSSHPGCYTMWVQYCSLRSNTGLQMLRLGSSSAQDWMASASAALAASAVKS